MMIPLESLLEEVKRNRPTADIARITQAYTLCQSAHEGQTRRSGEPYLAHPVEVAHILASHGLDEETIITGLLHDVVEDTLIKLSEIENQFGKEVAQLVDGVTKLSKVSFRSKDVRQSESFRKMLLAMAKDIRVIIIKLTDRLHNMRTLDYMPETKRIEISQETIDIYAPLAHRLGISWMKAELEDLAFRYLRPMAYSRLESSIKNARLKHDQFIARVISMLADKMKEEKVSCEITGRRKNLYSIFRKMEARNLDFEQIHDFLAFRLIVDSVPKCYEALGYIHSIWKPVPGRFKDFIALPKANLYQSLHTTVIGPQGERIEIQFRTRDMHRTAEEGIAAHWTYKSGSAAHQQDIDKFSWLRQMVDWQQDLKDAHEFIESVKIDLFSNEVYVFSPKGEVLDFPVGGTPLDFAYRIHSDVGHHCKGARVNGRIVSLRYKMQNGDTIFIITDRNSQPSKDWLKFAITSKARSKIRAFIKKNERESSKTIGHEILAKEFRKHKQSLDNLIASKSLDCVLTMLKLGSIDELLIDIGYGKLSPQLVVDKTLESTSGLAGRRLPAILRNVTNQLMHRGTPAIQVGGIDDVMVRFGKCCNPLPGDPILGFITRGRGVTVHRTDCYTILETDELRKIDVKWAKDTRTRHIARIKIISADKPGLLANVSQSISKNGGNISHASIRTTADEKAILLFDIAISDRTQLNQLIQSIEKLSGMISVERIRNL